ncbi:serine/threonine-protein kinase PAK 3-like [Vidua macroura]|uniref:serine/threonine-protein kinase PAK 3-like n=1 Tax=Vidua macroura TaxID=187451 RepID=UPI0023A89C88|nr:serine/threonine-protein kinase PAK 3-like [Vidua macroura]
MLMKPNMNSNLVNYLDSYLVDGQRWLVMEYMDGGTLSDVISETYLSEDEMAAISREVSNPTCAAQGLGRIVWETGLRPGVISCAKLCFCVAGMLWFEKLVLVAVQGPPL